MKHTKGPWISRVVGIFNGNTATIQINTPEENYFSGKHIAKICVKHGDRDHDRFYYSAEEAEANAKLIAAAPELLEALQNVIDYHDRCANNGNPVLSPHWEGVVRRAIKKATE
jgi:hypothetical protein